MKKMVIIVVVIVLAVALFAGCGKFTCDRCEETFSGKGYYGPGDETFCKDCAKSYWYPFPVDNYKK